MSNSSNKNMENFLDLLGKIERVEPKRDLLAPLLDKKEGQKTIPVSFVKIAAASLFLLISTEIFLIKKNSKAQEQTVLNNYISSPSYDLYHE